MMIRIAHGNVWGGNALEAFVNPEYVVEVVEQRQNGDVTPWRVVMTTKTWYEVTEEQARALITALNERGGQR